MVNPRVFFDVDVEGQRIGRIIMELFANECPVTAENFRALCTGERGMSKISGVPLHYRGSIFHRVIKGFMIQGGDFTRRDGSGGESIYGQPLQDEPFKRKHDIEGLLSMANKGPNTSSSQFFITTRPTPHLDGKHVVFGRVVKGYDVVEKIENMLTDERDRPLSIIMISNCGELELRLPPKLLEQKLQEETRQQKERSMRRNRSSSHSSGSRSESDSNSSSSDGGSDSGSSESESNIDRDRRRRKKSSSRRRSTHKHRSGGHKRSPRDSSLRRSSHRDRSGDGRHDRSKRLSNRARGDSRSRSPRYRNSSTDRQRKNERDEKRYSDDVRKAELGEVGQKYNDGEPRLGTKVNTPTEEVKAATAQNLPETDLRHALNATRKSRHRSRSRSRSQSPEIKYKGRGRMKYRERRAL